MNKLFTVIQGQVIYSNYFNSGLVLNAIEGNEQYPVEDRLARILRNKTGETVEQNIDFTVIERNFNGKFINMPGLCDKGQIVKGCQKSDGLYFWVDTLGEKQLKLYKATELNPVQYAQPVTPPALGQLRRERIHIGRFTGTKQM